MNSQSKTTFVVLVVTIAAVFIASTVLVTTEAEAKRKIRLAEEAGRLLTDLTAVRELVPIATSDNNVYVTW
jgi:hypothetical protein